MNLRPLRYCSPQPCNKAHDCDHTANFFIIIDINSEVLLIPCMNLGVLVQSLPLQQNKSNVLSLHAGAGPVVHIVLQVTISFSELEVIQENLIFH